MAEPFKEMINPGVVGQIAESLAAVREDFDREGFVTQAVDGLTDLELKARVVQVAHALRVHLADDWGEAVAHVVASLPPPMEGTEGLTEAFGLWPLCTLVELYGVEEPEISLPALRAMTQRFSAEFAIRPFLQRDPEGTLAVLRGWLGDDSVHVRRWISEGTRPRLPWGLRLTAFVADPSPTLPLLDALVDDPDPYVRRSVANHLNDVAKDHPTVALQVARRWAADATEARMGVVRHALRTLVKAGDPDALALLGFGPPDATVRLALQPATVVLGGKVTLTAQVQSSATVDQELLLDYVVHHVRANGKTSPKVFKGRTLTLPAGAQTTWTKTHSLRPVTTRRYYAGVHRVELQLNGRRLAEASFTLKLT